MHPLLLTLRLDTAAQEHFDRLRAQHFPTARNHLPAHVTLFHRLPGDAEQQVRQDVRNAARRSRFDLAVTGVTAFGAASVYLLDSPELVELRGALARTWSDWTTRQDQQHFRPHITVQNKVGVDTARALLAGLSAAFIPRSCTATGLLLWRYLGGPWELVETVPFAGQSHASAD